MDNMNHKIENYRLHETITNFALWAGQAIESGKIIVDGHNELASTIIAIARQFEKEVASQVDYNTAPVFPNPRDYWLEVEAYAELHLMKRFGKDDHHV